MLAANTSSPSSGGYGSPEYYGPSSGGAAADGGVGSIETQTPEFSKMEVDPNIFGQLQNIEQPFAYNPDPNDWMFDFNEMMADAGGVPGLDFDWGNTGSMGMGMGVQ